MGSPTARGAARRAAIAGAAARVVAGGGPDALTHRAVAAASGIPLGTITYHFGALDELRAAAVGALLADETGRAEELVAALPRRPRSASATARHVVDVVLGAGRDDDEELLSLYERLLTCSRHPVLRPLLRDARARTDAALTGLLDRCGRPGADVGTLVTLVDGSVLSALVEGDGSARRRAEEAVARALA
ncbi:TetR/AcrR family transcriptional regulator [Geodermatophilus sp. SYSU D01180]